MADRIVKIDLLTNGYVVELTERDYYLGSDDEAERVGNRKFYKKLQAVIKEIIEYIAPYPERVDVISFDELEGSIIGAVRDFFWSASYRKGKPDQMTLADLQMKIEELIKIYNPDMEILEG